MLKSNKYTHLEDVKCSCSTVFFVNFEQISQIVLVFYCRLKTAKCQLVSLNIRIYSLNKNGKLQWKFFAMETGTESCSRVF